MRFRASAPHMSQNIELRLGTRSSPLAMAQAHEARARLCAAHGWDESAIELVPVLASGDKVQDRPLAEIGGKALWTKELDAWLGEGKVDAAVHSMKDVETIRPSDFVIGAILPRADIRDVLVLRQAQDSRPSSSIADLPACARIGTSAPRRAAQMLHLRPDCTIVPFRGNVATRLARLETGEADATLLAAAGLARLGLSDTGSPLDPTAWLPAAAQGAIGIECRQNDAPTLTKLSAIDHAPSRVQVLAERALLEGLGGTCHSPIAVHCAGVSILNLRAVLFSPDGKQRIAGAVEFAAGELDAPRHLASDLLAIAAPEISAHFGGV